MSEEKIVEEEKKIEKLLHSEVIENKHIYEKLLEIERLVKGEKQHKFSHVEEWKLYVWNNCEFKTTVEKGNVIEHGCKKTDNPCHFVDCPMNVE